MNAAKGIWRIGSVVCLAGLGSTALAQPTVTVESSSSGILPQASISEFVSDFGTPLIVGDQPIQPQPMTVDATSIRLQALTKITGASGTTWRKVYRVTPAENDSQVTTLAQAQNMVDEDAPFMVSVNTIPEKALDKVIARADDAGISFPEGAPSGVVTMDLSGDTTAQAIAAVAEQTHTHWLAAYYVAPEATPPVVQVAEIPRPRLIDSSLDEDNVAQPNFILHLAPTPPVEQPTETAAAPGGTDKANQPVVVAAPVQPGQVGVETPMTPAIVTDPYGYNGLMYAPNYQFGGSGVLNPFE